MRCRACDAKFTDVDLARTNPHTGEQDDLCGACLRAVNMIDVYDDDDDMFPGTEDANDEWDD